MKFSIVVFAFVLFLASCGSSDSKSDTAPGVKTPTETPTTQTETPEPETEVETPPAEETAPATEEVSPATEVTLEIAGTDEMKYTKRELKAPAGSEVTLILTHAGKMTKEAMGHNFVLLKQGTNIAKFGAAAAAFKDNGYIPKGSNDIIVHTEMLGGGESDTIVFQAPAKGKYDYICSFPGHYALMKGKFIVE